MFALRGIAISLSLAILIYVCLSILVACTWQSICRVAQRDSSEPCANLLLALRAAPFVVTLAVTFIFAVPSFLLLEPRQVIEPLGDFPVFLAFCAAAFVLAGICNMIVSLSKASRAVAAWKRTAFSTTRKASSLTIKGASAAAVFRSSLAPPLTAAGVFNSSIWLSHEAAFVLTSAELQSALRHERIHVRRRDNLRKLLLRLIAFPGMRPLENSWRHAIETVADDAAVSNAEEAVDLAAAIVKLSRLTSAQPTIELTTALVSSSTDVVAARVARLVAWNERQHALKRGFSPYLLWAAGALTITVIASYSNLLLAVHTASEWLVR